MFLNLLTKKIYEKYDFPIEDDQSPSWGNVIFARHRNELKPRSKETNPFNMDNESWQYSGGLRKRASKHNDKVLVMPHGWASDDK